jgi:hypothetical protein
MILNTKTKYLLLVVLFLSSFVFVDAATKQENLDEIRSIMESSSQLFSDDLDVNAELENLSTKTDAQVQAELDVYRSSVTTQTPVAPTTASPTSGGNPVPESTGTATTKTKSDNIDEIENILKDSGFNERFELDGYSNLEFDAGQFSSEGDRYTVTVDSVESMINDLRSSSYDEASIENILKSLNSIYENRGGSSLLEFDTDVITCLNPNGCDSPTFFGASATPGSGGGSSDDLTGIINNIIVIIARLIPIVIGIGLLAFIWGIIKYVLSEGASKKKDSVYVMIYGVVAMFVMISVWGLVTLIQNSIFPGGSASSIGTKQVDYENLKP